MENKIFIQHSLTFATNGGKADLPFILSISGCF